MNDKETQLLLGRVRQGQQQVKVLYSIRGTLKVFCPDTWNLHTITAGNNGDGGFHATVTESKDISADIRERIVAGLKHEGYEVDIKWI